MVEVLDEASEVVSKVAAPWVGVLWLTAVPLRLLQAAFTARLEDLGAKAGQYGNHLSDMALAVMLAFLLSLWGRAVFVRACNIGLRSEAGPGREALHIPLAGLACYAYTALLLEALLFALGLTLVAIPILVVWSGLAAATHPLNEQPGLVDPLRHIARALVHGPTLLGLVLVFVAAWFVACLNLGFVFSLGLWLASAVPGIDPGRWGTLLVPANPRFVLAVVAGAWLALEPFWIGALTVYVHMARSRESGEDLRLWFQRLQRREAA